MDSQTKRTLLATALCLAVLFGWFKVVNVIYPPQAMTANDAPASSGPALIVSAESSGGDSLSDGEVDQTDRATEAGAASDTAAWTARDAETAEPVILGDDRHDDPRSGFANPYDMAVVVTPRGAGVESIRLSEYRNHVPADPKNPPPDPYDLLMTITDPATGKVFASFATEELLIVEDKQTVNLRNVAWSISKTEDDEGETAVLRTTILLNERPTLGLVRTYRLARHSHQLAMDYAIENLGDKPRTVILTQRGPVGLMNDDPKSDYRRVVAATIDGDGRAALGANVTRAVLSKLEDAVQTLEPGEDQHTLWTGLSNKYFTCIVTPEPSEGSDKPFADYLAKVAARALSSDPAAKDDMTFDVYLDSGPIAPGAAARFTLTSYCGPKSDRVFAGIPGAAKRHYELIRAVDQSTCTFAWLSSVMRWLLDVFHRFTRNYGIAIILLVIVVRTVLHPVTKKGQINMMRMQKNMARLKPKMEAVQEQYKNDKQKLNEAVMKLYREEGINPAGQFLGCLPMFLQMPVWVALWTTLNTNVDMRHEPFFGWIRDLSSPDALIPLPPAWHFNVPLLGAMIGQITAFNLLPILMSATMYAQQKFMQKLTKPVEPPKPKLDEHGNPAPDPMAQQQKMMSFMMIFFGLLFYNFPSGLSLYILSSNLLGMVEQYRIKKHIREKDERGEFEPRPRSAHAGGADGNGRPSIFERLAKKADEAKRIQSVRSSGRMKKRKKQARF